MDFNVLIGRKVIHTGIKGLGAGVIVDVDGEYVVVDFDGRIKKLQLEIFARNLDFEDEETRALVANAIKEIKEEKEAKAKADFTKKAATEAAKKIEAEKLAMEEAERLAKEKQESKEKRNRPIHPYIDERRSNGKHAIFLVCQNNNFQVESDNGFIYAPTHVDKGESEVASHEEMDLVKKGDIIFHHFANCIYAISVARADCVLQAPVADHPAAGKIGRYVELSYHILGTPANTSGLKAEKSMYGSMKYGPFTKHGENKQGFYLSELHEQLATIFIDVAIAANPGDMTLVDIKKEI